MFVGHVAMRVFEVVLAGSGHDRLGIHNEVRQRDNALVDEFLIHGMMEFFDERGVGAGKEFVELGGVREVAHIEAAHFGEDRMSVEELDQARNGLDLFEVFDDQGPKHGMAGESGAPHASVGIGNVGKVERLKNEVVFSVEVGLPNNGS